ncbi:hypothetical protein MTO96_035084 [Rhipicephalus appendiculatus]
MPDLGERRALHPLCDSVSGANWRPTLFVDELTLSRYACCVCHVIPSTTVLLPCSHSLCELCVTGCVVQDGGSVCPLDTEPFCEDECQTLKLPDKKKRNLEAHCWNEADGCDFVGTIEAVLMHYERECAFHAVQCTRCGQRILRTDIAAHYVTGCSQNASCASGAQPNRQDGSSTSCYASANVDKFFGLRRPINEASASSQDISRAVRVLENSLQRGMESVEANICTTITRQLNAGLEELKTLIRDPASDHLSSVQSQINEFVEQFRQCDASKIQEIVHVLRDRANELKEQVNRVEANLTLRLTEQQQTLQDGLASLRQNVQSANTEGFLAAAASGNEGDIPWRAEKRLILRKLETFAHESQKTLERLRQHIYRRDGAPWVSEIAQFVKTSCQILGNDSEPLCFNVTLGEAEKIFTLEEGIVASSNQWWDRDMHINIIFLVVRDGLPQPKLFVLVQGNKALENSGFPFTKLEGRFNELAESLDKIGSKRLSEETIRIKPSTIRGTSDGLDSVVPGQDMTSLSVASSLGSLVSALKTKLVTEGFRNVQRTARGEHHPSGKFAVDSTASGCIQSRTGSMASIVGTPRSAGKFRRTLYCCERRGNRRMVCVQCAVRAGVRGDKVIGEEKGLPLDFCQPREHWSRHQVRGARGLELRHRLDGRLRVVLEDDIPAMRDGR